MYEIAIGNLRAEPQHGGGDLRIEKRLGNLAGMDGEEIKILAPGVNDLFHLRIANEFP